MRSENTTRTMEQGTTEPLDMRSYKSMAVKVMVGLDGAGI